MLQHIDAVGGGDRDGAAGAAFADDDRDRRHLERQAGGGRARDGLGLASLLGADAGIGAGSVHQRQKRDLETVGKLHQAHRLAVAFRPHRAEIVLDAACRVRALLLADHRHRLAAEAGEAADDRLIVAEIAVAGQGREITEQALDVVDAMRPVGMAGDLHLLPGGKCLVEVAQGIARTLFQPVDLVGDIDRLAVLGKLLQLEDLELQILHRLFEIEVIVHAWADRSVGRQWLAEP